MPVMPPPSRKMISSANLWAIIRAAASLEVSVYCLPKICGDCVFFTSYSQPCTVSFPLATPKLPNASTAALGGGAFHVRELTSGGCPGVRSEEHTSELQSLRHLVCRLLLEKKKHTEIKSAPSDGTSTPPAGDCMQIPR